MLARRGGAAAAWLLISLVLSAAVVRAAGIGTLPSDIAEWSKAAFEYMDNPKHGRLGIPGICTNHSKFWAMEDLDASIAYHGSLRLGKVLLDKLNSGKPITAIGMGSSVTKDSGCFHSSRDVFAEIGIRPPSANYFVRADASSGKDAEFQCDHAGWGRQFMSTINATWPHEKHVWVNYGLGGQSLCVTAEAECNNQPPEHVDLVILDATAMPCPGTQTKSIESLIRRLIRSSGEPLIILMSSPHNCAGLSVKPSPKNLNMPLACGECLYYAKTELCQELFHEKEPFTPAAIDFVAKYAKPIQELAEIYDLPHLNLHVMLVDRFMHSGMHKKYGLSKWQLLSQLYKDNLHSLLPMRSAPREGGGYACGGHMLIADTIINLLFKYQETVHDPHLVEQHLFTVDKQDPNHISTPYQMPKDCAYDGADDRFQVRCYDPSVEGLFAELRKEAASPGGITPERKYIMDRVNDWMVGFSDIPTIKVLNNRGWELQFLYFTHGPGKEGKVKPGFLATSPGSVLEFELNSLFPPDPRPSSTPTPVNVVFTYTRSYDGWGKVHISCVSGCSCPTHQVDAHADSNSVLHHEMVQVTESEHCVMKVEVLQETRSTGHKFKLHRVMAKKKLTVLATRLQV